MSKNAIYLSGWEYNRIIASDPFAPVASGLPAEALWHGGAQFWLFERVYCTQESLDGEIAAAHDLGWTTGYIFEDLCNRGFLKPVKWHEEAAKTPLLREALEEAWRSLREDLDQGKLLSILDYGNDDELEVLKLRLMTPLLRHLQCVTNVSPNSLRKWITRAGGESAQSTAVSQAVHDLIEPLMKGRADIRAGINLCRFPGTGVDQAAINKQRRVEETIQKPLIPMLLAGILPQSEYHDALRPTAAVYAPINQQLKDDYSRQIELLQRLRDVAEEHLWPQLHGEWLPNIEADPGFLPEFQRRLREALLQTRFDPYLKYITEFAIDVASLGVGLSVQAASGASGLDPTGAIAAGTLTGATTKKVLDDRHERRRNQTEQLTLFFQKAQRITGKTQT